MAETEVGYRYCLHCGKLLTMHDDQRCLLLRISQSVEVKDGYVAWVRYVNDGNKIALCDSDANGAFKVYPSPPDANRYREKFNEAERTIQKVWEALGISTYEQAKPYAIWEHVERLRSTVLDEVREAVNDISVYENDQLRNASTFRQDVLAALDNLKG